MFHKDIVADFDPKVAKIDVLGRNATVEFVYPEVAVLVEADIDIAANVSHVSQRQIRISFASDAKRLPSSENDN